jgi:hypothetical protein
MKARAYLVIAALPVVVLCLDLYVLMQREASPTPSLMPAKARGSAVAPSAGASNSSASHSRHQIHAAAGIAEPHAINPTQLKMWHWGVQQMSDEFDDALDPVGWHRNSGAQETATTRPRTSAARLVSRLYGSANQSLRAKFLVCLVRPLSPLGLVAVATGAFAGFLRRGSTESATLTLTIDGVARYSSEQIFELASFVEQVSPDALRQFAVLLSDNPFGTTAFSASAAVLLLHVLRSHPLPASSRARWR